MSAVEHLLAGWTRCRSVLRVLVATLFMSSLSVTLLPVFMF